MRLDVVAMFVVAAAGIVGTVSCGPDGPDGPGHPSGGGAVAEVADGAAPAPGDSERGAALFAQRGCAGCHGPTGTGAVGPALAGIVGTEVVLDDGRTVPVDDLYLRRSIETPQADVVAGYTIRMPTLDLSPGDVDDLVAFIRSLPASED